MNNYSSYSGYSYEIEALETRDAIAEQLEIGADLWDLSDDEDDAVSSFTGESEGDEIEHREDMGLDWETSADPSEWEFDNCGGMDREF